MYITTHSKLLILNFKTIFEKKRTINLPKKNEKKTKNLPQKN